jgi:hypothetical protein
MKTRTVSVREGENVGSIDWSHEMAKDMPPIWHEAEQAPQNYTFSAYPFSERRILKICMYDGWPYWKPTPAILYEGPLGSEWAHFNSYGVHKNSIQPREPRTTAGSLD